MALQKNSLNSKQTKNPIDMFDKSETQKTTQYYQIRESANEDEEEIAFDKKQRVWAQTDSYQHSGTRETKGIFVSSEWFKVEKYITQSIRG